MLLGIDQGTTGTTALLMDLKGKVRARVTIAVPQHFPKPGWVEHDPKQVWLTVQRAVKRCLQTARINPKKIVSIGLTNQRETVSLFRGDQALHRFIVWQDRRTADFCSRELQKSEQTIVRIAGTPVDPYFSGSKIRWLLDHLKINKPERDLRFRTIESFLIHKMTGQDVTEVTNASRTSLLSLEGLHWSQELFDLYGIPLSLAPRVIRSQNSELRTKGLGFLPDGIPISGILGDQQAALFGQLGWRAGVGKITYGTGSFILLNTGETAVQSKNRLVTTVALQWGDGRALYALEGSVFVCGAWIQFLRDQWGLFKDSSESERLAKRVNSSEGVKVFPTLTGLGAPFWRPEMRGMILGLTRGTTKSHLAHASLEALAFQNRTLVDVMARDARLSKLEWRVDGGAVKNSLLLQIQADTLGASLYRPTNLEATASGAALLAGHQVQAIDLETIQKSWHLDREFKPSTKAALRQASYNNWFETLQNQISLSAPHN